VVTCSSRCHKPPSAGSRRCTSSAVRLVFQLDSPGQLLVMFVGIDE
jgi:hypothetical protein